ncbi:methyl-accepting chemotaxis protein [Crassaminicella thermophila]|uniref:Methyl-accepting chemotaxis protein n=1 Tax=Crassaminicella thermophila TaxID=2599308 RepID=A0A5C0SD32_CRATE|nr:methyl-accepting chemotaxis protein [Crassaminicella thermophila]QEK11358.1 methyl-accepting chemotaxis protein [Crassaminicella thermophila]
MKRISTKIILAVVLSTVIISTFITIIVIKKSSQVVYEKIQENLSLQSESTTNQFNSTLLNVEMSVKGLKTAIEGSFDKSNMTNPAYIKKYMNIIAPTVKQFAEHSKGTISSYFFFNPNLVGDLYYICYSDKRGDGNFIRVENQLYTKDDFYPNNEDLSWYYNASKTKKGIWSDVYISDKMGQEMISYTSAVYIDNILIGVIGMNINFEIFENKIHKIKLYDTGYAFLLNKKFDYLIHPTLTRSHNLTTIADGKYKNLAKLLKKNTKGISEVTFADVDKILSYERLKNGWFILIAVSKDEIFKEIKDLSKVAITITLTGVILSMFIALYIGKKIAKPITLLTELIDKTKNLDLIYDERFSIVLKYKDETGKIAKSIVDMRKSLREIATHIKENSKSVTEYANHLATSTSDVSTSVEGVVKAIEELASGSTAQAKEVQEGVSKLSSFANKIKDMTNSASLMEQYSNETIKVNQQGMKAIMDLENKFEENNKIIHQVGKKVNELSTKSSTINEIVNAIESIAEQTNLLALNAAIEAARAGKAGRGFAVVAEEIRKLAVETRKSTKNIEIIVNQIQSEINGTKNHMDLAQEINKKTNQVLKNTAQVFNEIEKSLKNTVHQIENVTNNIKDIDENKDHIVTSMQEISAISEASAASTEEVSASIEEQSTSIEVISNTAQNLNEISIKLKEIVDKFHV